MILARKLSYGAGRRRNTPLLSGASHTQKSNYEKIQLFVTPASLIFLVYF